MARVRHYFSYDEGLAEWRRFGLPETFGDRRRLVGNIIVIEDEIEADRAEELIKFVNGRGGEAHLCRKTKRPKVVVSGQPQFYEQLAMDCGEHSDLVESLVQAVSNYHREFTPSVPFGRRELRFDRPLVMGILNITPDSFSDGGMWADPDIAVNHARDMIAQGADIIDIGAESTRPGASPVGEETEIARLTPVISALVGSCKVPISIDTRHASVADEALRLGAHMINDISGLRDDAMLQVLRKYDAPVIAMHMKGDPQTMQQDVRYDDLVGDIFTEFYNMLERVRGAGIRQEKVILDPGIGFGKNVEQNLEIIRRLREFRSLGRPIMIGTSRKSFIGTISGGSPEQRLEGSLASAIISVRNGANIVRVHDVRETVKALAVVNAIENIKFRPY